MANLFEKPIAANPISTYAKLPLQFMAQMKSRQESEELRSIQMIGQTTNALTSHKALGRDLPKQQEIIQGYENRIGELSELDDVHQSAIGLAKLKGEIAGNKQLQAYNSSYVQGMKERGNLQERYEDKKIGRGQYSKGLKNLASFETTQDEFGNYSGFTPYNGSNIYDVRADLVKIVKGTHEQFDDMGQGYKNKGELRGSINSAIKSNPQYEQAIMENFETLYRPGQGGAVQEDKDKNRAYIKYRENLLNEISTDESFQRVDTALAKSGVGSASEMLYTDFAGMSTGKINAMEGGQMATIKSVIMDITGLEGGRKTFDDYTKTDGGKFDINYLEKRSGTKMPSDYLEAVEWVEKNTSNSVKTGITGEYISPSIALRTINNKGFFTNYKDIRGKDGRVLSKEEVMEKVEGAQKDANGQVQRSAKVLHRAKVGSGYVGRIILQGKDGEIYTKGAEDVDTLKSFKYNNDQITDVKSAAYNGRKTVNLRNSISNGNLVIPSGRYEARHFPSVKDKYEEGKSTIDQIVLYQNGKAMFSTNGKGEYRKK